MNIGLIGSKNTIKLVEDLRQEQASLFDKVYMALHACSTLAATEALIASNHDKWDAIVLTDIPGYAYTLLNQKQTGINTYYIPSDAKMILAHIVRYLNQSPNNTLNRMYIDMLKTSDDAFHLENLLETDALPKSMPSECMRDFTVENLFQDILNHYKAGSIDVVLTGTDTLVPLLSAESIPHIYTEQSKVNLTHYLKSIFKNVELRINHNKILTVAYIELADRVSDVLNVNEIEFREVSLHKALVDFRHHRDWDMNIQKLPNGFELSFPLSKLQTPANYLDFPLIDYLKDHLTFDFYSGLGAATLGIDAGRQSAYKACEQSKSYGPNTCFYIDMDEYVYGPVGVENLLYYKLPSSKLDSLAKSIGVHSHNLARVMSLFSNSKDGTLDSNKISDALNITMRSVNRILTKLVQAQLLASVQTDPDKKQDRGRPKNFYRLTEKGQACC